MQNLLLVTGYGTRGWTIVARIGRVVADPVGGRPLEIDGVHWGWRDSAEAVRAGFRSSP